MTLPGERQGSNYEEFQKDAAYQKALDGRTIDRTLLTEMKKAYEKVNISNDRCINGYRKCICTEGKML